MICYPPIDDKEGNRGEWHRPNTAGLEADLKDGTSTYQQAGCGAPVILDFSRSMAHDDRGRKHWANFPTFCKVCLEMNDDSDGASG